MARARRDKAAGVFHVCCHSVWAATLFRDDRDRVTHLRELARAGEKAAWTCLGYCLMTNHYHLILDVPDGAMPTGMHSLNFRYAMGFNHRYGMKGHVHGARYEARRVEDDDDLLNTFSYVMRNPVEAGLCEQPADWPWSSYAATIGLTEAPSFVAVDRILACFGQPREIAVAQLRAFVESS